MVDTAHFVDRFKAAIELEQKSDIALTNSYLESYPPKKLAQLGLAVINLIVSNVKTGLGGKTLLELTADPALKNNDDSLQIGSLRVGDIVKLDTMSNSDPSKAKGKKSEKSDESIDCVIIRTSATAITVSIEEDSTDDKVLNLYNNTSNDSVRMWIVKLANSVTYKRMVSTMNKLAESENKHDDLIKVLLGQAEYSTKASTKKVKVFFNDTLNESQKNAINFAIYESPISIIHGPPGTGKTYTLIELIKQLTFNHGERVLVCGPSNISVDTILERLSPIFTGEANEDGKKKKRNQKKNTSFEKLIRIGHPARLLSNNLQHSLDILSKTSFGGDSGDAKSILRDIEKDIGETLSKIKKCKRYSERRVLWSDLKQLKKELREREKKIVQDLVVNSQVVLSTLHGAGSYELTSMYKEESLGFNMDNPLFDTIIIDEVSQSMEPQCWIPLVNHLGFKRLVIAGDDKQLPPTVKSKDDVQRGSQGIDLEVTLFDRLVKYHQGEKFKKLLDTQYRMNEAIMKFPSQQLYDGKLKAHESVKNIRLNELPEVETNEVTESVCIWYDTQGGDFPERSSDDDDGRSIKTLEVGSKFNELEAVLAAKHLSKLIGCGLKPENIGIISPYSAQVTLLKKGIQEDEELKGVEISTVDGFQGREKEAIIISLVRSNEDREVGFLKDERRLNVAMTRAKRHLCVIGDLELMRNCGSEFLRSWALYVEDPQELESDRYEISYPDLGDY